MRAKAHTLVEMIGHLENAVDLTQALLRSAGDLLLAWDALRPEERRERLQQLVGLIVVEKAGPGGDSNMARIHFRAVIGSREEHRKALKDEIAEKAPGAKTSASRPIQAWRRMLVKDVGSPTRTTGGTSAKRFVFCLLSPRIAPQRPLLRTPRPTRRNALEQSFRVPAPA